VEPNATDNSVPREINALLSGERLILLETQRAVTPFGGVAVFLSYLRKIDLIGKVRSCMPVYQAAAFAESHRALLARIGYERARTRRWLPATVLAGRKDSGPCCFRDETPRNILWQKDIPSFPPGGHVVETTASKLQLLDYHLNAYADIRTLGTQYALGFPYSEDGKAAANLLSYFRDLRKIMLATETNTFEGKDRSLE
jgi:hypothetical protein